LYENVNRGQPGPGGKPGPGGAGPQAMGGIKKPVGSKPGQQQQRVGSPTFGNQQQPQPLQAGQKSLSQKNLKEGKFQFVKFI
jgi:hypothetical protein